MTTRRVPQDRSREALDGVRRAEAAEARAARGVPQRIDYVAIDATGEDGWAALAKKLDEQAGPHPGLLPLGGAVAVRAPSPSGSPQAGIATPTSRIVVEKPLGHDLASARR